MITLAVDHLGELDALGRTVFNADTAAFALLSVYFDCAFECHFNIVFSGLSYCFCGFMRLCL
jgi:hypothetical protein